MQRPNRRAMKQPARRATAPIGRGRRLRRLAVLPCVALVMSGGTAWAQVSAQDGFTASGSYQWNFEVDPYLWLPASRVSFNAGPNGQFGGETTVGIPSFQQLTDSLHGAFMGYALTRYGPYSGELDFQWINASQGKTIGPDAAGRSAHLSLGASLVRVAPGFGYQVYNGAIGGVPVTLDARAGFSWFTWSTSASSLLFTSGSSQSGTFVQPWLGFRASIYPAERWRVELGALGQGFGVEGGSWGWGTSLIASYSVNSWCDVSLGFRALSSERYNTNAGPLNSGQRALQFTEYGPLLGVGFRF